MGLALFRRLYWAKAIGSEKKQPAEMLVEGTRVFHGCFQPLGDAVNLGRPSCPNWSLSSLIASSSRLENGKHKNRLILRSRIVKASRKARSICSCEPLTAVGSGTSHCPVMACPGHIGHSSLGALSETVHKNSRSGDPGYKNSSVLCLYTL